MSATYDRHSDETLTEYRARMIREAFDRFESERAQSGNDNRRDRDNNDNEKTKPAGEVWDDPEPLARPLTEADPYPIEAFGKLASVVEAIARLAQAPLALAGQSVLGVVSLAVQPLADVTLPTGEAVPSSVYLLSCVESGGRKSTTDRYALRGVRAFEEEDGRRHRDELRSHRDAAEAWRTTRGRITGPGKPSGDKTALTSPEAMADLREKLQLLGTEPKPPMLPGVTTTEPTAPGLLKRFEHGRPSLGLLNPEGGSFLAGHAMNDDNRRHTAAVSNALWDGAAHNRDRAGDGSSRIAGKRLCMHVAATPGVVGDFLARADLEDNGALSRFLVAAPASLAGSRLFRDPDPADQETVERFEALILNLLRQPLPLREGDDDARELHPPAFGMDAGARELWREFHDEVERELGAGGKLHAVRARVNKSAENAARVALLLTVANDPAARVVGPDAMAGAVELVAWYINECVRLAETGMLDPRIREAEELRRWLVEEWAIRPEAAIPTELRATAPPATVAVVALRDCYTFGPSALRTKAGASASVAVLVAHHWLAMVPTVETSTKGGRRRGPSYYVRTVGGEADGMA